MTFISITRLRVKSVFNLLQFMKANEASVKSIGQIKGFITGKELVDKSLVFWTLTAWESEESMKQFRNGNAHRAAMQKLPVWCDEGAYHHWVQEDNNLPDWDTASKRLMEEGKLTKVKAPSKAQQAGKYPPIKWKKLERRLK